MPNGERKHGGPLKGESPIKGGERVTQAIPPTEEGGKERVTQAMPPSELQRIEREEAKSRIPYLEEEPGGALPNLKASVLDARVVQKLAQIQEDARSGRITMEEAEQRRRELELTLLKKGGEESPAFVRVSAEELAEAMREVDERVAARETVKEANEPSVREPAIAMAIDIESVKRGIERSEAAKKRLEEADAKVRKENLKEKKETLLPKLWPDGIKSPMKQGPVGDCYAVAALDRLKNFKNGEALALDMIEEVGEGKWQVRFYESGGLDKKKNIFIQPGWVSIDVSKDDLEHESRSLNQGALGDRIIERAYFRFIHRKRGGEAGKTMAVEPREIAGVVKPRISAEGGAPYRALHNLVGPEFQKIRARTQTDMKDLLAQIAEDMSPLSGKKNMMALAATKERIVRGQPSFLGKAWEGLKVLAGTAIYGNHAYAIHEVDLPDRIVLVNPHDTSKEKIVTLEEFFKYFDELYVVRQMPKEKGVKHVKTAVVLEMNR